jgi:spermidine synthase
MVTLMMANLATPETVFAKGYSSGGGSTYVGSGGGYSSGDGGSFGWLGFWTMIIGVVWLRNLSNRRDE